MLKRLLFLSCVLFSSIMTMWAQTETTYSPTLDVNFRTAAGNTAWQTVKDAAVEGNNNFELNLTNGFFALQKYTVADLQNASKLVLTLTVGNRSGVDAVKVWAFADNTWTAESGIDDILPLVTAQTGVAPRTPDGTPKTPLVNGAKVTGSDPAKATFTISGTALATIKATATEDGTFTLLLTNNDLTSSGNNRSYLSNNSANDEANRPTLVATIETPSVKNITTGATYSTLTEAFNAAVSAGTDAELEVYDDQTLSSRLTWNKATTLTITPKADITIKGHRNGMWFLANVNNGKLNIGGDDYTITLDGQSNTFEHDVTKYENAATIALTNVTFQNFNLNNVGHLVGSKANEGQIILDRVTFKNCSNPAAAFIDKERVTNDRLVLKGFLNQESCTGTTIYAASETKSSGTTGRIKIDDANFTASAPITINWPGTKADGIVVVIGTSASNADKFQLTDSEWTLERKSNGDLVMAAPATPTAKIGDTEYADLAAALAAVQDGETITLLADQEISGRVNVKNQSITIDGQNQYAIKRASSYTNGLLFLTQKPDEGMSSALTLQNTVLDGQNVEATSPVAEASNNGTTILKNVVLQNCKNVKEEGTQTSIIVNKSSGKLVLDGVTFTDCTARDGMVFVGTNNVTVKGNVTIPAINIEGDYAIQEDEASATAKITLNISSSRHYGLLVGFGKESNYDCTTSARLSAHATGIYLMPAEQANSYSHPALLHTADDISAATGRLDSEPYKSAYNRLETQSGRAAVGAVEYLKRLDEANWGPSGSHGQNSDFNNYTKAANDARLAYQLALRYQLKGSTAAADAAVAILNNWASTCKGIYSVSGYDDNIPDPNEYLINIQGHQFANAAELLRSYSGWNASDFQNFQTWMKQTFAENAIIFLEKRVGTHFWANWDLAALTSLLSVGILCDDKALVDYAINYTANGAGMGSAAHATTATHSDDSGETLAQCQESGRDQGHSTLDVSLLGVLCQTAANAGAGDLFTSYNALEMAEYVAKYNLKDAEGNFVYSTIPFTSYTNGEYSHDAISADGRGSERNCWELFHAYAKKNSKADKYTEAWVKYFRQKNAYGEGEASTLDELGFGTLMYGAEITYPAITVTVKNASRQYGETNPAFEYEISGGTAEQLGGTIELTCEATATSGVGEYAIKAAKGTATYPNIVFVDGKLTITKAALTISGGTYSMKQGDALPEFKAVYEGFKNDETEEVLTKKPTLATTATSSSAPGEYEVTVSGAEAANYEMTYKAGNLVITNADAITVTVKNASRQYGEANPAFEYEISGGTAEQLGGTIELTCEATATSGVGEYAIKAAKGTATYPNIVFVDGKLTITKAPLTITAKSYMIKQGEALPEFEAEYAGFKNDETASVLSAQPTITTTATSASEPGTYDIVVSEASAANYDITYVKGTLTISAVEVTPIAETETTTFSETVNENTDLSNTIIDNTYFTMNAENGDGYDATEQAIVLNSTTTTEQMNTVQNAQVGDATMQTNYNGIIFEVPAGSGTVMVDAKTLGTHVLNVQIGSGEPTKIVKSERGTADVNYSVASPTYVYLYASSSAASGAPRRAAASNSVLLYSYKVTVTVNGIEMVTYGDLENAKWYTMDGRQLPGKPTKRGLYIVNGRKIIIK